jgi:hypothetical protein
MLMNISLTSKMEELLMFTVEKMRKEDKLLYGRNTMEPTKDGMLSILTKLDQSKLRE